MLREWLSPDSLDEFRSTLLGRSAWARAGVCRAEAAALDWRSLGALLGAQPEPDVLVVAGSRLLERAAPRSLPMLRGLMNLGIGICVRHAERHDPALRTFTTELESELGGQGQIQLFATPGGTHGFGWHFDAEDVFIVQTAGVKDYYFRENTVSTRVPTPQPDFSRIQRERSALQTARLLAGDCLYLPRYWWHMAKSIEDSLSISLGVLRAAEHAQPDTAASHLR